MPIHGATAEIHLTKKLWTDGQTDGFSALYSGLAKVPALSHRLGRILYDHAFGAVTRGCTP